MAYQYSYQPNFQTYLPQQDYRTQYIPQPQQQMMQQPTQGAPIWVQGEAGAKSFLVAPGQSLILMDSESEVFYIKSTDASGVPMPLRIFDYRERTGAQRPSQAAQTPTTEYVTRAEFEAFVAKFAQMTAPTQQEQPQKMRRGLREEETIDG